MPVAPLEIAYHFLHDEPRSAARLLETRDKNAVVRFLEQAPVQDVAATLLEMQPNIAGPVLVDLKTARTADLASLLNNHQLSALLRCVPDEKRQPVLAVLPEWRRLSCKTLLQFEDDMVGVLAQTDIPLLSIDLSVEECLVRLKKQTFRQSGRVYFIDRERKPMGSIALAALMFESPRRAVNSLALENVPQISGRTPLISAIHHAGWKQADTLAVVSSRRVFVGTIEHHALRSALAAAQITATHPLPATELMGAFSASMMGLLELFEVGFSNTGNK